MSTTQTAGAQPAGQTEAETLLMAGAVLPLGTRGAGERAVALTARAYRHPVLDDRVVVRLVPGELGAAEDLAAGFLGLTPDGEPAEVGLGVRQSLSFPEWVLVHYPQDGRLALSVVPELERVARQARTKPKAALDAYKRVAGELASSVPHFLPTFYEQAGRVFLGVENATYAAQMFNQARNAESEHGLLIDEDRLDAVFLEFALSGALPMKALSGYGRDLMARVPAAEALRRYRHLCVRRATAGFPPTARMGADLRRLAKATGSGVAAEEESYLAELLSLPAVARADAGWWKAHRPALISLAGREPGTRGTLLDLMPADPDGDVRLVAEWLELLELTGATTGLCDASVPAAQRPSDGTAGWLTRYLKYRDRGRAAFRIPGLYQLVVRLADQLRTELAAQGRTMAVPENDVDLLDLFLSLGVPVADPDDRTALDWGNWARDRETRYRRDLVALEAQARFRPAFRRGADAALGRSPHTARLLAQSPGGRPMLREWVRDLARNTSVEGLPGVPDALRRLERLPDDALDLAKEEVRAVAGTDLVRVLSRTLRNGLFDELGWPAWEEAAAALVPERDVDELVVGDAWPYLIVAGPAQVRVLDAAGVVLTHDLRIPPDDRVSYRTPGFHYVDGELYVAWTSSKDWLKYGYWHTAADRPSRVEEGNGTNGSTRGTTGSFTLAVPGGGRTTGGGVLHRGDSLLPSKRSLASDGTSFWAIPADEKRDTGWREYDPRSGRYGRRGMPGFFTEATRDAPEGSIFSMGVLLPAASTAATPAATPVDGLIGWRWVRLPDHSVRCEDLAGHAFTVPSGVGWPARSVVFPGDDRPRGLLNGAQGLRLIDEDGIVTSAADRSGSPGPFAAGTLVLPPESYWHCLTARDPHGSQALRRIGRDTVATLLTAAVARAAEEKKADEDKREPGPDALPGLIRAQLPEVTHEALVAGIAGVARFAAAQHASLETLSKRLDGTFAPRQPQEAEAPVGPGDQLIRASLNGLVDDFHGGYGGDGAHHLFRQLRKMNQAVRETGAAAPAARIHLATPLLPETRLHWDKVLPDASAAVAFRAATAFTEPVQREALDELLGEFDALGLATNTDPARWRRYTLFLEDSVIAEVDDDFRGKRGFGLLPLGEGAFLAVTAQRSSRTGGREYDALLHDPAGRFDVPAPYTVVSSSAVGEARQPGWLAAFRAELAGRGPAPWFPAAAEEFARLAGVTPTTARLVVAGLPHIGNHERNFLPAETLAALEVKAADAAVARDRLCRLPRAVRQAVVGALLPAEPALLWTDGPDVAAAAETWLREVGRRPAVPEALLGEAARAVRSAWDTSDSLPALLDPAAAPELSRDRVWAVRGDRVAPVDGQEGGFGAVPLIGACTAAAWLAHRLPAGDPIRAALPAALQAVRERLANPDLMFDLGRYVSLSRFRKVAGAPTETGPGYERYGAVIMATHDDQPAPGLRPALLDAAGNDPYLAVLRNGEEPFPAEVALRTVLDPRFAALLADPGNPSAGELDKDGTWYPQDPSRSVPDLVTEAAEKYGIGEDAAVFYLMLLTMPDPTDANTARWTGWKSRRGGAARIKAARTELAATDLVTEASRPRAGRSLFLPGGWVKRDTPVLPLEQWKLPLFDLASHTAASLELIVPTEPVADLYRRAWQRVREDDVPRFETLDTRRGRRH